MVAGRFGSIIFFPYMPAAVSFIWKVYVWVTNDTKISKKMRICFWQNSAFFSQISEKHPNTHGPTASAKTTAKIIVFYSKW